MTRSLSSNVLKVQYTYVKQDEKRVIDTNELLAKRVEEYLLQEKAAAEEVYDKILKDFIAKHPEGYHLTLKDGDNVVTLSSQNNTMSDLFKDYNNLLDYILKSFK